MHLSALMPRQSPQLPLTPRHRGRPSARARAWASKLWPSRPPGALSPRQCQPGRSSREARGWPHQACEPFAAPRGKGQPRKSHGHITSVTKEHQGQRLGRRWRGYAGHAAGQELGAWALGGRAQLLVLAPGRHPAPGAHLIQSGGVCCDACDLGCDGKFKRIQKGC